MMRYIGHIRRALVDRNAKPPVGLQAWVCGALLAANNKLAERAYQAVVFDLNDLFGVRSPGPHRFRYQVGGLYPPRSLQSFERKPVLWLQQKLLTFYAQGGLLALPHTCRQTGSCDGYCTTCRVRGKKMRREISVTQAHIDRGVRFSTKETPLAFAFAAAGFRDVSVGGSVVALNRDKGRYAVLPQAAIDFTADFDENLIPVYPFTFKVEL